MARKPGQPQEIDKGRHSRIDISVNERGALAVTQRIYQLASTLSKISPAAARSLRGKALRLGINTTKLIENVAVAALTNVVTNTPVDTGQAKANWKCAVRISRPLSEPEFGTFDKSGQATIAEGEALIRSTPRPDGHSIYISNALPYIKPLNEGHSTQAAAGFVEMAVQEATQVAKNANILKVG